MTKVSQHQDRDIVLSHNGMLGTVEYSYEDKVFFGKVLGIEGLISYEGDNVDELKSDFKGAVDEYLSDCKKRGWKPEKTKIVEVK